jgi:hypothetical protein
VVPSVSGCEKNTLAPLLPGLILVERGVRDLGTDVVSMEALIVSIGAPSLRRLGLEVVRPIPMAEHRLYELLSKQYGDSGLPLQGSRSSARQLRAGGLSSPPLA